jgi:predicted  nucleic acid-binding Zn-ribbon protein
MGDDKGPQPTGTAAPEGFDARHAQLLQRDHVVGIEAEIGRQNAEILRLSSDLRKAKARSARLNERKESQAKRLRTLQSRLQAAQERNARLDRRIADLEAQTSPPSLARRIARRLRGPGR